MNYHLIFIENDTSTVLLDTTDKCGINYYNMDHIENKRIEINSVQYAVVRTILANNNNSFAIKIYLQQD